MFGQSINEVHDQITSSHDSLLLSVLRQKFHFSICNLRVAMLGNGWAPNVQCHIPEEVPLRPDGIDLDIPASFVLCFQHFSEFLSVFL
jgi:hypothetical protein